MVGASVNSNLLKAQTRAVAMTVIEDQPVHWPAVRVVQPWIRMIGEKCFTFSPGFTRLMEYLESNVHVTSIFVMCKDTQCVLIGS